MPIYAMGCNACNHTADIYRSIAKMNDDLPTCCGAPMQRRVTAAMVATDIQPYRSQITGEIIASRSQHRSHLKQHGMIEVGNEKIDPPKPMAPPPGLKETLIQVVNEKLK